MMNHQSLNDEGRQLWDQKAAFWDNLHGDNGNLFHRRLISPAVERLLDIQPDEMVLDVACGNGVLSRRLAELGAKVTATDFSTKLIELAQAREQSAGHPIQYHVVDATDEAALVALGHFDAVVCTMALMDMPVIAPLYRAVRQILKPGGRFVIATAHPAFNSNNPIFYAEMADRDGSIIRTNGLKINTYRAAPPVKGTGAPNEPNPHYYYHRSLSQLLSEAFIAGLVLDGIEEPTFTAEDADPARGLSWLNMDQIPPIMAARFLGK